MAESKLLKGNDELGVSFESGGTRCEVRFGTKGEPSGRIRLEKAGQVIADREFTRSVQPQQGLAGNL